MGLVKVINRNSGSTIYQIPERNITRTFAPKESKMIDEEELNQLSFQDGGEYLLKHYLIVESEEALDALNISVEPEYFYDEKIIEGILLSNKEESLAQLEDTLTFGPDGVVDIIKKIAIEKEIPDSRKRKIILEKTGFNIDNAININRILNDDNDVQEVAEAPKRKAAPVEAPKRKAAPVKSKYNVVEM